MGHGSPGDLVLHHSQYRRYSFISPHPISISSTGGGKRELYVMIDIVSWGRSRLPVGQRRISSQPFPNHKSPL